MSWNQKDRITLFLFFFFFVFFIQTQLTSVNNVTRRNMPSWHSYRGPYGTQVHRGWNGRFERWPTYYAYYGTPYYGSSYYYSYPLNATYYYSYPSYYTNYTYPSYPYTGVYYTNDYGSRYRVHPTYKKVSQRPFIKQYPSYNQRARVGVFLNP